MKIGSLFSGYGGLDLAVRQSQHHLGDPMDPYITITGNLTADPELRFTPSGAPVANFTVAHTPRVKQGNEWQDGEVMSDE